MKARIYKYFFYVSFVPALIPLLFEIPQIIKAINHGFVEGLLMVSWFSSILSLPLLIVWIISFTHLSLIEKSCGILLISFHVFCMLGAPYIVDTDKCISNSSTQQSIRENVNAKIFISSIPPVANIIFKDSIIGSTNVSQIELRPGLCSLQIKNDSLSKDTILFLNSGINPSIAVRLK